MWTEIDQIATMTFAKEQAEKEGLAKGLAKGLAEGRAKERREIVMGFIKAGASDEMIEKATGMSPEDIAALRASVS